MVFSFLKLTVGRGEVGVIVCVVLVCSTLYGSLPIIGDEIYKRLNKASDSQVDKLRAMLVFLLHFCTLDSREDYFKKAPFHVCYFYNLQFLREVDKICPSLWPCQTCFANVTGNSAEL